MRFIIIISFLLCSSNIYAKEQISNIFSPVSYFVNRAKDLEEIKQNLKIYKKASLVALSGMGKTQVVRKYGIDNNNEYEIIWSIDCSLDISEELLRLVREINRKYDAQILESHSTVRHCEIITI